MSARNVRLPLPPVPPVLLRPPVPPPLVPPVLLRLLLPVAMSVLAAPAAAQHPFYPLHIGDRWTYDSSMRGQFTNVVTDTLRVDGQLWFRVESTDEQGMRQVLGVAVGDDGIIRQRVGTAPPTVMLDLNAGPGHRVQVQAGTTTMTATLVAEHDTLTILGSGFRNVREYRQSLPNGQSWSQYFARDIGLVAMDWPNMDVHVRLLRADVGGRAIEPAVAGPSSGIATQRLSPVQVENLALLGTVWGFVKYHHPAVTGGAVDWDAELLDIMPGVLAARDVAAAAITLDRWLARLGEPPPCAPCATPPDDVHLEADNAWIDAVAHAGLRHRLHDILRNRSTAASQKYVSLAPGVGNPQFTGEAPYLGLTTPDAGFRLLALFRYWNIIRYWFPYRDLIDDDWDAVLREFVPVLMAAEGSDAYRLALLRLVARIHDTHASVPRALPLRPPAGPAVLPVTLRFIEGSPVVTGYYHDDLGPATGLRRGDAIVRIDGMDVDSLVHAWTPYYPASNQPARLRDVALNLTAGPVGSVRLDIVREGRELQLTAQRVARSQLELARGRTHDQPGPPFRMLDDDVAYLRLSGVSNDSVPAWFERASAARVLVIDIRNYPAQFVVFTIGSRLVDAPTPFASFTNGDLSNPGAFRWRPPVTVAPAGAPRFERDVVVLVDESSLSQAEYTAMALRAAGATIVGSRTAAADGNVSMIRLPGGIETLITGIGVFYPDRTPTQRIGIIPDIEVRPSIAGVRTGRDEVLEAAVRHALGRPWRQPGH